MARHVEWDIEDDEKLLKLRKQGLSISVIAQRMGVRRDKISEKIKELQSEGFQIEGNKQKDPPTEEQEQQIVRMYADHNHGLRYIMFVTDRSIEEVRSVLAKHGIPIRSRKDPWKRNRIL